MKRFALLISLSALAVASALAQPVINVGGILQAATFSPPGLPNAVLAPGGFFTIFGTGFNTAVVGATSGQPIPTTLGGANGTAVTFTVGGAPTSALVYFADANQINGILPSATPTGAASVTVTFNGQTSAAQPITIVASNFGEFTLNGGGTGPAAVQNYPSYKVNHLNQTAEPGSVMLLYGTGLGPGANNLDQTATGTAAGYGTDLRKKDNLDLHVYVGGVEASISYAGRSNYTGEDQINFTVPASSPLGCYVPVIVRSGTTVSNSGSVSITSDGNTCVDPMGLTQAQVNQAATGKLNVGTLVLTRLALNIGITITQDDAEAHFYGLDGKSYYSSPIYNPDFIALSSFGSCAITTCSNTYTCVPSSQGLPATQLDAGGALSVSGNAASSPATTIAKVSNGYAAHLGSSPLQLPNYPAENYLQPASGPFSFTGPGGADVSAFSASISVPAALTLNAKDSAGNNLTSSSGVPTVGAVINRSNDLTVSWPAGSSSSWMLASVSSAISTQTADSAPYNSVTITCLQPASAGSVTFPSWLLQALPVSSKVSLLGLLQPSGAILVGPFDVTHTFTATGVDVGLANSIVSSGANFPVK